jgi:DNA-binding NarL/FixJ family response regulator
MTHDELTETERHVRDLLEALQGFHYTVPRHPRMHADAARIQRALDGEEIDLNLAERRELIDYLVGHGHSIGAIAQRLHCSRETVSRRAQKVRLNNQQRSA